MKTTFPTTWPYTAGVPCFGLPWGFQIASKEQLTEPYTAAEYERRIASRITGELRYLSGALCAAQFVLPKHLLAGIESQSRLIEDDRPLYMYH